MSGQDNSRGDSQNQGPYSLRLLSPAYRRRAKEIIDNLPEGWVVVLKQATRTDDQNAKMWPMLRDLSRQIEWHGHVLSEEEWKDFATATLKEQTILPNIDGTGFIAVGGRTSRMGKRMFSDLIEIIYMIGSRVGVEWSEDSITVFDEFGIAHEARRKS